MEGYIRSLILCLHQGMSCEYSYYITVLVINNEFHDRFMYSFCHHLENEKLYLYLNSQNVSCSYENEIRIKLAATQHCLHSAVQCTQDKLQKQSYLFQKILFQVSFCIILLQIIHTTSVCQPTIDHTGNCYVTCYLMALNGGTLANKEKNSLITEESASFLSNHKPDLLCNDKRH